MNTILDAGADAAMDIVQHKDEVVSGSVVVVVGDCDGSVLKKKQEQQPGTSMVKSEYIDVDYKPRLVSTYLPEAARDEIQQVLAKRQRELCSAGDRATVQQTDDAQISGAHSNGATPDQPEEDARSHSPPAKKSKLKGRNKKRPIEKRPQAFDKLCASIVAQRPCTYGERCKFSHDVDKFISEKPKVHSLLKCPVFSTYGACPFGVTCLYSDQHNKDSLETNDNVTGEHGVRTGPPPVINTISKDLQIKLRKHEFNFSRANKVLRQIDDAVRKQKKQSVVKTEEWRDGDNVKSTVELNALTAPSQESNSAVVSTSSHIPPVQTSVVGVTESVANPGVTESVSNPGVTVGTKVITVGCVTDEDVVKLRTCEKPTMDFKNKLYLAPLTTVGNLPFRRVCKRLGADITCGEMAMPLNLLQGQASEWALLKRHETEKLFGVQLCGSFADTMTRASQVICENLTVDFIDINIGCPIDLVVQRGEGCALMNRVGRFEQIIQSMKPLMNVPLTVKMRTGMFENRNTAHTLLPKLYNLGVSLATIHGRSRDQRYTRSADWAYIKKCVDIAAPLPVFGNGDILSYEDYNNNLEQSSAAGCMIARGALVKPWMFTEIKEQRHWDISSSERLDIVREFVHNGLEHWGSDQQGVSNTRRFLLEWLSFLHRYVPVGILERVPQRINEKPPHYFGRNDLETLMASSNCADWIKISEMLLGPVPDGFTFLPKHRANSFA